MSYSNYHIHTTFCDGKSTPEEYVLAALSCGMKSIGFSAHVPLPFPSRYSMKYEMFELYLLEIERLKSKYAGVIEIYAGLEMDYVAVDRDELFSRYIDRVDYTIGSVHYIYYHGNYHSIEGATDAVANTFAEVGDSRKCVEIYYQDFINVVKDFQPSIIGHLDVIKKRNVQNQYFDQDAGWYQDLVMQLLAEIEQVGSIVEVNSGGINRGYLTELYPANWILIECHKMGIPITISSDAHQAKDIMGNFELVNNLLKQYGFKQQKILHAGVWVDEDIK